MTTRRETVTIDWFLVNVEGVLSRGETGEAVGYLCKVTLEFSRVAEVHFSANVVVAVVGVLGIVHDSLKSTALTFATLATARARLEESGIGSRNDAPDDEGTQSSGGDDLHRGEQNVSESSRGRKAFRVPPRFPAFPMRSRASI